LLQKNLEIEENIEKLPLIMFYVPTLRLKTSYLILLGDTLQCTPSLGRVSPGSHFASYMHVILIPNRVLILNHKFSSVVLEVETIENSNKSTKSTNS